MENLMRFRHNAMEVTSLSAFEGIRGGMNQNCKDVYFVRLLGVDDLLISDVEKMDKDMKERMNSGHVIYRRMLKLPLGCSPDEIIEYEGFYRTWLERNKEYVSTKVLADDMEYAALLGSGLKRVLDIYAESKTVSVSMEKNFIIKMLYWHDFLLKDLIKQWNPKQSVKIVLSNIEKKQEYLFACLLTCLGCDILLLQSERDISKEEEALGLSQKVIRGSFAKINFPDPEKKSVSEKNPASAPNPVSIARPVKAKKPASTIRSEAAGEAVSIARPVKAKRPSSEKEQEKSFEQLAQVPGTMKRNCMRS